MCLLPTANEHIEGRVTRDWTHFMHNSPVYPGVSFFEAGLPSCTAVDDLISPAHGNDAVPEFPPFPRGVVCCDAVIQTLSPSLPGESPSCREMPFPQEVFSLWPSQVGHDGATPESCWLMEELTIVVPTKGVMYNFVCKCWLARDKGDGLTSRILNILDAECVNIGIKVGTRLTLCL